MTPLQALEEVSAREHAKYWQYDVPAPDCHLLLCQDCTVALLRALEQLFRPTIGTEQVTLVGSQIMGCTFDYGPVETCALHTMLREDAACR